MHPVTWGLLVLAVLLAAALQTMSGFGFALAVMPLMTLALGLRVAAPLVALISFSLYVINVARYRAHICWEEVVRLGLAAAVAAPLGVWALSAVPEAVVKGLLGGVMVAYALYNLWRPNISWRVPAWWGYPAGFLAGGLGGAYNTPGPPVILYGRMRGWSRDQFRSVLQAFFLVNGAIVIASHYVARHFNRMIVGAYGIFLPALILGVWLGARVDRRLDARAFHVLVNLLILSLGVSLVL